MNKRKFPSGKMWWLPFVFTIARFGMAGLFVWTFFKNGGFWPVLIYLAGEATDVVDGWLARKLGTISELGARLDGLADTVMIVTVGLSLVIKGLWPIWLILPLTILGILFTITTDPMWAHYDPLRKPTGLLFFTSIFLTLCFPYESVMGWVVPGVTVGSMMLIGWRLGYVWNWGNSPETKF
ncbi:MAG TPA: CDP-alcohol phosphatidyltransferase family protein [archaeon]|nr:CDP-alcohol phosphatidyltransferase family protein [archaeon]